MRFPGLKSRKSSTLVNNIITDDDDHHHQHYNHNEQPQHTDNDRPNLKASTSGSIISLSRWKSHGSTSNTENGQNGHAENVTVATTPSSSTQPQQHQQPQKLTKRSLFGRRSHSRSVSIPDNPSYQHPQDGDTPPLPQAATISAATGSGGHPLRQQTLPVDLLKSPPPSSSSKRPGLSFPRRSLGIDRSLFSSSSSSTSASTSLQRASTSLDLDQGTTTGLGIGGGSGSTSSPSYASVDGRSATLPLPYRDSTASRSSESFQLKSFRAVSGVREEPTLSSLVDAELTHSPLSTRPNSPSATAASAFPPSPTTSTPGGNGPYASTSSTSYFDARQPTSLAKGERSPASISVSRFREARAARSTSSLGSTVNQTSAAYPTPGGGLNLDLPPPINLEYSPRPSLSLSQPDLHPSTGPDDPLSSPILLQAHNIPSSSSSSSNNALSRVNSASPTKETFATAPHTMFAVNEAIPLSPSSPTSIHSATFDERSSAHSHNTHGHVHPLAYHPDNALPLPPVPVDPERHARRTSNQSISSLSAALGGWLNSATAGVNLPSLVDDVQKSFQEQTANLRQRRSSLKDPQSALSITNQPVSSPHQTNPYNNSASKPTLRVAPSREEMDRLLGGKILPPPPSETSPDYDPSIVQASPKTPLSRASSFSNINLGFARNLFASGIFKAARPAKDDDDDDEDDSEDSDNEVLATSDQKLTIPTENIPAEPSVNANNTAKSTARPVHAFDTSSSDDSDVSDNESDDTDEQERKRQKALVFPPPRPKSQAEKDRIYRAALTPPAVTPNASQSDLRQYAQLPVQPMPRVAALTLDNVREFDGDSSDDDENVPLSTIRLKAQSELGLLTPSQAMPMRKSNAQSTIFTSVPVPPLSKAYAQSNLNVPSGPRTAIGLPAPNKAASSIGMPRSLSAFSTASSDVAVNQKTLPSRSASSHAIPNLASSASEATPQVTLSSLIESELSKMGGSRNLAVNQRTKKAASTISRPDSSSGGSYPKTPSDLSEVAKGGKAPLITFESEPSQASTLGRSTRKGKRSTVGDFGLIGTEVSHMSGVASSDIGISRHNKSNSTPFPQADLAKSQGSVTEEMKARHREEARKSGIMPSVNKSDVGHAGPIPGSGQHWMGYAASPLSPQSLQAMPPPPGVDMALYASLPNDQKLALHMRSQQLMAMMQNFALQAQHGGLEALPLGAPTTNGPNYPFGNGMQMPMMPMPQMTMPPSMQMPMMGSNLPSFPTNMNFFGSPTFFPGMPIHQAPAAGGGAPHQQLPFSGAMAPYASPGTTQAFSAIGLPTAHQQAHRRDSGRQL